MAKGMRVGTEKQETKKTNKSTGIGILLDHLQTQEGTRTLLLQDYIKLCRKKLNKLVIKVCENKTSMIIQILGTNSL